MSDLHVCRPRVVVFRTVRRCPECGERRRIVGQWAVWYGTTWTCCGCGDSWCDGERLPRPFEPGWRKRATRDARTLWRSALPRKDADAAIDAAIRRLCEKELLPDA